MEIFPATPVPSFSQVIDEEFKTLVSEFESGAELRTRLSRFGRRSVYCDYKAIIKTEMETLRQFRRKVGGMADAFWFVDFQRTKWVDEFVGRGLANPQYATVQNDSGVETEYTPQSNNNAANDVPLLPTSGNANDALYFGYMTPEIDTVKINQSQNGAGTWTITWEYNNGTAWTACGNVADGTSNFRGGTGNKDVDFDRPSPFPITTVKGYNAYWLRARVSAYTSMSTQPKAAQAWGCQRLYDLHGVSHNQTDLIVYVNNNAQTGNGTNYTFITGGGGANADRVKFNDPPAVGALITADQNAYLRIKARLADDKLKEEMFAYQLYKTSIAMREVLW